MATVPPLRGTLDTLLRRLETATLPTVESANAEFLEAMVALEKRLRDVVADDLRPGQEDSLAELISNAPLSRGERELLHDLRRVRNAVVHNADVHVGRDFGREALRRLRQIARRLEGAAIDAATLMTRDVQAVRPDEPLERVWAILRRRGISQVAVVDDRGHLAGWVTSRSLLRILAHSRRGAEPSQMPATAALARGAVAPVAADADLEQMAALLEDPEVQSLAVMEGERLAGIITRGDLLRVVV